MPAPMGRTETRPTSPHWLDVEVERMLAVHPGRLGVALALSYVNGAATLATRLISYEVDSITIAAIRRHTNELTSALLAEEKP